MKNLLFIRLWLDTLKTGYLGKARIYSGSEEFTQYLYPKTQGTKVRIDSCPLECQFTS